jgi:hypothetical protein
LDVGDDAPDRWWLRLGPRRPWANAASFFELVFQGQEKIDGTSALAGSSLKIVHRGQFEQRRRAEQRRQQLIIVGGPVGLSPPLFFILAGKLKFKERRKRGKNYQKTDGPRTDDTTISASTNKMKLVRFYSPAIRLQRQNI